jgi:uncharacterized C2H2 Zn-finger protein
MTYQKSQKIPQIFECNFCDYISSNKKDYNKHLTTLKHIKNKNTYQYLPEGENNPKNPKYCCICGNVYKHKQSLYNHKNKCNANNIHIKNIHQETQNIQQEKETNNIISNFVITPELIMELIKDNKDMKQIIIEQNNTINNLVSNGINNINNNTTHTNSHNKSFNLNLFLNETCKNAMNIMDFANSIQVKLTDLENVGELGYVEGISKIIIDNLKLLDVTERPVHCSDKKRDVLYVRDNDKWEIENENNTKIKKIINCVTNKNISLISEWKQKNPDCTNSSSNKSTKINKMIMEIMETDSNKNDKIIKKIAKEVAIEKE